MITLKKNTIAIMNLFRADPLLKATILKIAKKLRKAYPRIHEAVIQLEKSGILKIEKIGNSKLVSLSFSPEAVSLLSFLDEQEAITKEISNMRKILAFKEISDYLIIITGSYASGKNTKNSDLDLVLIIPNDKEPVKTQKLIENMTITFTPAVHLYIFTQNDFIKMLLETKGNYGKEIYKNHLLFKNTRIFYELIKEAQENGFKG